MKRTNLLLRALSLLLAMLFVLTALAACSKGDDDGENGGNETPDPTPESGEFVPAIRFAVTSDVHWRSKTKENDLGSNEMLAKLYTSAYAYSGAQSYNKLDAIFFAGDFTQNGSDAEMSEFFAYVKEHTKEETVARAVLGNHEYYATRYNDGTTKDDRYSDTSVAATYAKYKSYGGYDEVDAHLVIGGYHFLVLNTDRYSYDYTGSKFSPNKLAWLETELGIAAADDPTGKKPIFVFQHMPATGTVNNVGQKASDDYLEAILTKFPQVVDFSGHTHLPVTDPQSIWQGGYTAINTGSLAYLGTYIAGHPTYDTTATVAINNSGSWEPLGTEKAVRNACLYYFVEVSTDQRIRLVVYNIFSDNVQAIINVGEVGDTSKFTFTEDRVKNAATPKFATGAKLTVSAVAKGYAIVTVPQATCKDTMNNYRVELYRGNSTAPISTTYRLACAYLGNATPATVTAPLLGLAANTSYTVKVYPISCWGKVGKPLTVAFTTADATSANITPDILATRFNLDGTATNTATGKNLFASGTTKVEYDAALGRNVAVFDGTSCYQLQDMYDNYKILATALTLETYCYIDDKPASGDYVNPFSNMESGGFGYEYKSSGKMHFYCNTSDSTSSTNNISAKVKTGEWVHLVATYDSMSIKLYINGELAVQQALSGPLAEPSNDIAFFLCIGADSDKTGAGNKNMKGKIATANLYSEALTAAQITALYGAYQ